MNAEGTCRGRVLQLRGACTTHSSHGVQAPVRHDAPAKGSNATNIDCTTAVNKQRYTSGAPPAPIASGKAGVHNNVLNCSVGNVRSTTPPPRLSHKPFLAKRADQRQHSMVE